MVYLACYSLKFWGATSKRPELTAASARLATARAALRLFDDAAVIRTMHAYGLGKQVYGWHFTVGYCSKTNL